MEQSQLSKVGKSKVTAIGDWWLQVWNANSIPETKYQNSEFVTVSRVRLLRHQVTVLISLSNRIYWVLLNSVKENLNFNG